jgi:serine/threonine protein kinase
LFSWTIISLTLIPRRFSFNDRLKMLQSGYRSTHTLLDYAVDRTLGTGSFGRVLLAQGKDREDFQAVKIIGKDRVVKTKQVIDCPIALPTHPHSGPFLVLHFVCLEDMGEIRLRTGCPVYIPFALHVFLIISSFLSDITALLFRTGGAHVQ